MNRSRLGKFLKALYLRTLSEQPIELARGLQNQGADLALPACSPSTCGRGFWLCSFFSNPSTQSATSSVFCWGLVVDTAKPPVSPEFCASPLVAHWARASLPVFEALTPRPSRGPNAHKGYLRFREHGKTAKFIPFFLSSVSEI